MMPTEAGTTNPIDALRLLIIEDSEDDAMLLERALQKAGYQLNSRRVWNRETMREALQQGSWDIALSDFMLPGFAPQTALAMWLEAGFSAPFIVISGEVSTEDVVALLKGGASDFVRKDDLARLAPAVERGLKEFEGRQKLGVAENALHQSEEYNRQLFQTSPIGLVLCRMDGRIVDLNPAYATIIGRTVQEAMTLSYWDITPSRYAEQEQAQLLTLEQTGRYGPYEKEFIHKEGHLVPVRLSGIIVRRNDEDFIWSTVEDITEKKKIKAELENHRLNLEKQVKERTLSLEKKTRELEKSQQSLVNLMEDVNESRQQLESANERLLELDRLKSMFIASMSHELRTPLNSIIGFTGILLQGLAGELNEEQRDQLGRVGRAGKHLLSLITDVIDVSKIEVGKIDLYPERIDLGKVISEVAMTLQPDATAKGLTLTTDVPAAIVMESDHRRLLQCLMNLIGNAVKYSERGTITVTARQKNGEIEICVADQGIGIAEADLPLVFNSFTRFDSHLKTITPGTGLGLYLTRKIARELLSGEVFVESTLGKGSIFRLQLPLRLAMNNQDNNGEQP